MYSAGQNRQYAYQLVKIVVDTANKLVNSVSSVICKTSWSIRSRMQNKLIKMIDVDLQNQVVKLGNKNFYGHRSKLVTNLVLRLKNCSTGRENR